MKLDILVIQGKQGGFENILFQTSCYLMKHGFDVRFVQMVNTGVNWTPEQAAYVCLGSGKADVRFDEARAAYAALLTRYGAPDLILAAGWPYTVYIAKGATADTMMPVPVVAWLHGDVRFYEESGSGGTEVLQYADIIFAISNRIADDLTRALPGKVIYRINNTVYPDRVCFSTQRDTFRIACVSRLSEDKAVAMLLYAMELTEKPWELVVAGSGPDEANLRRLAKQLGIADRVTFLGWQSAPWKLLSKCRALVVTSLYEGAPLSVLEALCSGMQVVSTPAGFMPELLEEGVTGFFYPFGDPKALAHVLDKMGSDSFVPETAERCRESVADYMPEPALWDIYCKVVACARRVFLPQRYEAGKLHLLVRDKAFVILLTPEFDALAISDILAKLTSQTIESSYFEVIVVDDCARISVSDALEEAEYNHPETILVVKADGRSIEDLPAVGEQYAKGGMVFRIHPPDADNISPEWIEQRYLEYIVSPSYGMSGLR